MKALFENRLIDNYIGLMKNWTNDSKNYFIVKLQETMKNNNIDDVKDFSKLFGAWDDNRSADEIIDKIIIDRINYKNLESF